MTTMSDGNKDGDSDNEATDVSAAGRDGGSDGGSGGGKAAVMVTVTWMGIGGGDGKCQHEHCVDPRSIYKAYSRPRQGYTKAKKALYRRPAFPSIQTPSKSGMRLL